MFDELYPEASDTALTAKLNRPAEPQAPRFSAWRMLGAAPKGVVAGAAQAMGSTADILGAYGSVMGTTGSGGGMFALPTDEERKQQNEATDKLLSGGPDYMSEGGRNLRNAAAFYTPDPVTTHAAEGAVFNLFRMGSKAITAAVTLGNIPGAIVAGAEEGFTMSDELAQQGVDIGTRTQVGAVNAVVNAAAFALPVAGKTWMQTGALALVGGPISFVGQQAATREILQAADYTKQAEQYDPFDPLGLALSTVIPLGFGALAMRGARAKGPAPDAAPDVPPVPKVYPADELVDAARVSLVRQHMDDTNPAPGDLAAADAHIAAYKQAMEQMAAGERVKVDDIAPRDVQKIHAWDSRESANVGDFVKADFKLPDSQPVYQMREMSPSDLYLPELDANGKLQPEKRAYLPGYVERAKAGELPPAVTAIEMDDGRIRIVDGHRRVLAAQEAGKTIRVLVSPLIDTPAGRVEATAENIAINPITEWGAGLNKALGEMLATPEQATKPTPDIAAFIAEQGIKLPDAPTEAAPVKGNAFIAWLKEAGGVAWSQKVDIVGERGVRGNYAGIFTKNGQNLDTLVAAAEQAGYLSRADVENINDIGGTRALSELIRRATTGEKIKTAEAIDAANMADMQARALADDVDYMERELKALGVDPTAARGNADVLGTYLSEHRDALISRRLDELNAEIVQDRAAIGEEFNLTPKQIDEQSRIALASELDENAAYDAAVNSTDQVDYLNRIEEVIRNAPRGQEAARSSASTAPDGRIPQGDGQQAADTGTSAASPTETRLNDIAGRNPQALDAEIATAFDDAGKPTERMTVRDYLDQIKREAIADEQDAGLLEVAANCFLSGGL